MEKFSVEQVESIAVLTIKAGRANAMDRECLDAIAQAFGRAEADEVRGVVLTGYDRFFSAGLDLIALYDYDRRQMAAFLERFNRTMLQVFAFPKPVVAAVNGHAIAAGCILALACDVRMMVKEGAMLGLNEWRLGLSVPAVALEIARFSLPEAHRAEALSLGKLYPPKEAKGLGFVQELLPRDQLLPRAVALAKEYAEPSVQAYGEIKAALRRPFVQRAEAALTGGRDRFLEFWFAPEAREAIGQARAELLAKKR